MNATSNCQMSQLDTRGIERLCYDMKMDIKCPGVCFRCSLRINNCRDPQAYKEECSDEPNRKICKASVCVCCLGLLQPEFWPAMLTQVRNTLNQNSYDSDTFACGLSFPAGILIREHSVELFISEKEKDYKCGSLVPLKQAWKWSFGDAMASSISKTLDSGAISQFLITLHSKYKNDTMELEPLKEMCPQVFIERLKSHKKYRGEDYSRVSIENMLSKVDATTFKNYFDCPPSEPLEEIQCTFVECTHNPIYLGGRYIKYSRELSQTPWIVDGKRIMEGSIQEIVFQPIAEFYNIEKSCVENRLKFISSGREDVDVRCLGDGRPFVVEISNPNVTRFTGHQLKHLADSMSVHSELVKVHSLQPITRSDLHLLKLGEETKTKTYEALCIKLKDGNGESSSTVNQNDLDTINSFSNTGDKVGTAILQKTPLRVLHRRPLLIRSRTVHSMKAFPIEGKVDMFTLLLTTQAGTYIKEFVHGDFGRTTPNLAQILGCKVDILALDVKSVNLEWPSTN